MGKKPLKIFKVKSLADIKDADSIYCVKSSTDTEFTLVVTDSLGNTVNLKDLQTPSGIQGIISDDGTIEITGGNFKNIRLSATLVNAINSSLKTGDNISDLVNDAGYLTSFTEVDPIFQASEASNFVSGDKANLDNQSGVNTGDETVTSIQAKRPLKTVDNKSLEGTGNIEIDYNTVINKPTEFPPSAHTHTVSQITDFPTIPTVDQTIIDGSTNAVSGNAVKSQLDLKQNTLNWKTPQDYGAVGNGIEDDTAAINACLSANSNVLLYGTYKISSTINIQSNQFIFSNNCTISSVVTGFVFLKADNVNNWGISGKLKVTGSGYSDSTSKALNVIGGYNYSVKGMIISEIDGWGILVENGVSNGTRGQRGTFSNIYINNCWTGIETGLLQEYTTLDSFKVTNCYYGCTFQGGNINLLNSNINDNINGVYIGDTIGSNNGHGIISNTNMNHNTGWNLRMVRLEYGQTITGCHFYGTGVLNIQIVDSYGITFDGCIIDGNIDNLDSNAVKGTHLISNSLIEPSTNYTGEKIYVRNCITRTDSQYLTSLYDDGTKVGIGGTITPTANLEVIDSNQTALGDGNVTIRTTDSQAADKGGFLTFGGSFSGTSRTVFGGISGRKENSANGNIAGYLSLYSSSPTLGLVEAARINSNGTTNFNYNVTAPTAPAGTNTTQVATTAFVLANTNARPYKSYIALLNQISNANPVATVIENTLGGTVVWSRTGTGVYNATLNGAFLLGKTTVMPFFGTINGGVSLSQTISGVRIDDNSIGIRTSAGGTLTDVLLLDATIEIRVYN